MTTEDKILIAKFDGYTIGNVGGWVHGDRGQCAYKKDDKGEICELHNFSSPNKVDTLAYETSWDALMPVVEKIESLHDDHHGHFLVHISSNTCSIQGTNLWKAIQDIQGYGPVYMSDPNAIYKTKIESTFMAVVAFIKWYNENLKTK